MSREKMWLLGRALGWCAVVVSLVAWHLLGVPRSNLCMIFTYASGVLCGAALPVLLLVLRKNTGLPASRGGSRFLPKVRMVEKWGLVLFSVFGILINLGWQVTYALAWQVQETLAK